MDTIRRAARDLDSWTDAQWLEKEDGSYADGQKVVDRQGHYNTERPAWTKGKSWAWCLWKAAINVPADIGTFSLVARVG